MVQYYKHYISYSWQHPWKEIGQYPAMMASCLVNNVYIHCTEDKPCTMLYYGTTVQYLVGTGVNIFPKSVNCSFNVFNNIFMTPVKQ